MKRLDTPLAGVFLIRPRALQDDRGWFVKTLHQTTLASWSIDFEPREEFYSVSRKDVLRGMHFQTPPHAHAKLVYCITGSVLDVILDLRRDSATYGRTYSTELSADNKLALFVPRGLAHGFLSLRDGSIMVYKTSHEHAPACDKGILWNSFGFSWPVAEPILSGRDRTHPGFAEFETPF